MDRNFIITSRYFMDANLFLRNKFGYNVGIDLSLHRTMTEYFDLPGGSMLPVLEQEYCEADLRRMKQHMVEYSNTEQNLVTGDFESLNKRNVVIDMWPESSREGRRNVYWVPEDMMRENAGFIRENLVFKPEYRSYAADILQQLGKGKGASKEDPVFVGLHVRRGDYIEFSKKWLKKVCI